MAPEAGLPLGTRIRLEPATKRFARNVLFGGSPPRALRLSETGVRALEELRAGPVDSPEAARLARRLVDAGMANPLAGPPPTRLDATVVIPVRDRVAELRRCLEALGREHPVVVVDDGSRNPGPVAATCAEHGARVLRRDLNGGPGAARNSALASIESEFVAFLDSDCLPPPGWIEAVAGHFRDPLVAAVAPRIVADVGDLPAAAGRYMAARSPLDLGDRAAMVAPMAPVSYVPTAALVVRRAALGDGFDEQLRYGEDVDLVWRLVAGGWRVRYEPAVQVAHREPTAWTAILRRRYDYGTSAAPLARRHPGAAVPLVLQPWPTLTVLGLLDGRPVLGTLAYATGSALLAGRLGSTGLPLRGIPVSMGRTVWHTFVGMGRWSVQFGLPALAWLLVAPGGQGRHTRWWRRLVVVSLLSAPSLSERERRHPGLDPFRFGLAVVADEASYGAGVWRGCVRERVWSPLLPSVRMGSRRFGPLRPRDVKGQAHRAL